MLSGPKSTGDVTQTRTRLSPTEGAVGEAADPHVLEDGGHTYYFECKLPPELPSSFEGQYGQIRYLAKAYIDRPSDMAGTKAPIVTKQDFTVLSGLDLNFIPEAAVSGGCVCVCVCVCVRVYVCVCVCVCVLLC